MQAKPPPEEPENLYVPPGPEPLVFEEFIGGLNTLASRPGIDENQMSICDGFMPLGRRNLRTLPGIGPPVLAMNPATGQPYPVPPVPYPPPPPGTGFGAIRFVANYPTNTNTVRRTGPFSGVANSPTGTFFAWFKNVNAITAGSFLITDVGNFVTQNGDQSFDFGVPSSGSGPTGYETYLQGEVGGSATDFIDVQSTFPFAGASGIDKNWHVFATSWNTNAAVGSKTVQTVLDGAIINNVFASDVGVAFSVPWPGQPNLEVFGNKMIGTFDFSDIYLDTNNFTDFTVAANMAKIITAAKGPVDQGATGSFLTGHQPALYFALRDPNPNNWPINKGFGGGFTLIGNLTTAPTLPVAGQP